MPVDPSEGTPDLPAPRPEPHCRLPPPAPAPSPNGRRHVHFHLRTSELHVQGWQIRRRKAGSTGTIVESALLAVASCTPCSRSPPTVREKEDSLAPPSLLFAGLWRWVWMAARQKRAGEGARWRSNLVSPEPPRGGRHGAESLLCQLFEC